MGEAGSAERLRDLLRARGLEWTAPIECRDTLPSTNDRLKSLAQQGGAEWTTVVAAAQTAGRGRHGRVWTSPPGGLYLSVLLRPTLGPEALGLLPLAAGVAVAEAVREAGVAAQLKWPNDVLVGERKIAGILAEASLGAGGAAEWVVLGAGVNVSGEAPPEAAATTFPAEGRPTDRLQLAAAALARLAVWYHALHRPPDVLERWRALSVPWWGRPVEVGSGGARLAGIAHGVDERGALLLERSDGSLTAVHSGEARELRLRD